jgi:membrane protease YdiL (CAAX protease family)
VHCSAPYREPDSDVYGEEAPYIPPLEERLVREERTSWNIFFVLGAGLVLLGMLSILFPKEKLWAAVALQELFILVVVVFYCIRNWNDVAYLFKTLRVNSALLYSVPVLALLLGINQLYHEWIVSLFDIEDARTWLHMLREQLSPPALTVMICLFPSVFEEIAFRGIIQQRLVRIGGLGIGMTLTSVLFTLLHMNLLSSAYLFLLSLFLCWVRDRTCSVYPPMVLHFIHNAAVLFVLNPV